MMALGALAGESKARLLSPLYEPEGAKGLWEGEHALCPAVEAVPIASQ